LRYTDPHELELAITSEPIPHLMIATATELQKHLTA
jgi:hypothetical protein